MIKVMTIKYNFYLLLLILTSTSLFSQGLVESDLTSNMVLVKYEGQKKSLTSLRSASITDTINLIPIKGLIDDFSYDNPYPDTSIWLDNYVYINRGYAKAPITIGVATFDGLNEKGYPYNFVVSDTSSLPADSLTSKPINLSYQIKDSIYFSFFCQPQGIGNKPEYTDSLILEFKAPGNSSPWKEVWYQNGSALAAKDSSWTRVMIAITDSSFLKKGFQFRFRNYATLSGNLDHWHIDYVYLNKGRTATDTIFSDISWVYNGASLLKNYRNMPWKQYKLSEFKDSVPNLIRNNYKDLQNINYNYKINNETALSSIGSFNGVVNILPFDTTLIYTDCDVKQGCIETVTVTTTAFPITLTIPTDISIKHYYSNTIGDLLPENDTLTVHHKFSNYFAYDDGTAENSVGLNRLDAELAEKFSLNVGDTLQCIDIYFNPIENNATLYGFELHVWNDAGGKPGTIIYTSSSILSPVYEQKGENAFTRYVLDAPLLLGTGAFYIGFTQKTDQYLNVGQDKNTNTQDKTFIKFVGGDWQNSTLGGSVMMHPIFGTKAEFTGIESIESENANKILVYPNPANDRLYLQFKSTTNYEKTRFTIVDLMGRVIIENTLNANEYIDISNLTEGIYMIRFIEGDNVFTTKFIKQF
jgi:hypothetical protein